MRAPDDPGGNNGIALHGQDPPLVADKNERRQGIVGKKSSVARYVPSDEKKDKVKIAAKKKADGLRDTTRPRHKRAHLQPKGLEGQREYGPPGSFQSTVSLNLDFVRDRKGAFFAGLHGLKANVLLFQYHRLRDANAQRFVIEAAEKVFRSKNDRFCAVVPDPLAAPNGKLYGGAMIMVHPHYSGRVVAKLYDNRGLGRYAAIARKGERALIGLRTAVFLALGKKFLAFFVCSGMTFFILAVAAPLATEQHTRRRASPPPACEEELDEDQLHLDEGLRVGAHAAAAVEMGCSMRGAVSLGDGSSAQTHRRFEVSTSTETRETTTRERRRENDGERIDDEGLLYC